MKLSRWFLPVIVVSYIFIYGALIYDSSGLPYVFDNNETFSSLWHAQSLSNFGICNTKGLADEVFSPHPEASPFVHTHQGNFPRLFAWLIYEFGAKTASSQIVVTTFTIGLSTILLAYLFFAQIGNPLIAVVASLVFMTDYLLFAQWQIVTYRVWYGFLLFVMLLSIEKIKSYQYIRWYVLLFMSSVCLLYFEMVFAAFVGLWCALWTAYRMQKNLKLALKILITMSAGASVGLSIFLFQAIDYLTWPDFLRDINTTFTARNNSNSSGMSLQELYSFYESKRVIFWFNFQDKSAFANLEAFFRSIVENDLTAHTPYLVVQIYTLFICWVINYFMTAFKINHAISRPCLESVSMKTSYYYLKSSAITGAMGFALYYSYSRYFEFTLTIDYINIVFITAPFFFYLSAIASKDDEHWSTILYSTAIMMLISWLLPISNRQHIPVWKYLISINNLWLVWIVTLLVVFASIRFRVLLANNPLFQKKNSRLQPVLALMVLGFISYGIIYYMSPGYIYSGYISRLAPFTVFITDLVYVVVFSMLILIVFAEWDAVSKQSNNGVLNKIRLLISVMVMFGMLFFWCETQINAVRIFPPNHFNFTKKLASAPYSGATFIVNNYAAPIAAYTQQWAYMDPQIANANTATDVFGKVRLIGDNRYLWFADKKSNESYRRPDYFICVINQTVGSAVPIALRLSGLPSHATTGCDNMALVKIASELNNPFGLRLIEMDTEGLTDVGFVRWAIVKFDWDRNSSGLIWKGDSDVSATNNKPLR